MRKKFAQIKKPKPGTKVPKVAKIKKPVSGIPKPPSRRPIKKPVRPGLPKRKGFKIEKPLNKKRGMPVMKKSKGGKVMKKSKGGMMMKKSKGGMMMKKSKGGKVMKKSKGGMIAGNANRRRQRLK